MSEGELSPEQCIEYANRFYTQELRSLILAFSGYILAREEEPAEHIERKMQELLAQWAYNLVYRRAYMDKETDAPHAGNA